MTLTHKYFRVKILMSSLSLLLGIGMAVSPLLTDGEAAPSADQVHPEMWPMAKSPVGLDATIEKRITEMLSQMSIEEKIGQVIQPEWKTIKPEEVTQYRIGSIENGGGAVPVETSTRPSRTGSILSSPIIRRRWCPAKR